MTATATALRPAIPSPQESRQRECHAALARAIRAIEPDDRGREIDAVLKEVTEEERRKQLLAEVEQLSTDELDQLVKTKSKPKSKR